MRVAVVALTENAARLAAELATKLDADLHVQHKHVSVVNAERVTGYALPVEKHSELLFAEYEGLIYVMASGIVVRCVAPLLRSKLVDPGVVVVDERGRYAISLLSGHLGGANELALRVAAAIGAEPVITTATDLYGLVACDVLARNNDCHIENPALIKVLNTALLEGKPIGLHTPFTVVGATVGYQLHPQQPLPYNLVVDYRRSPRPAGETIYLRPRRLRLGIGCRRGTSYERLASGLQAFLAEQDICATAVASLASIDIKADEPGLLALAERLRLPLLTFSGQQLAAVPGVTTSSAFVQQVTGSGNVCEAAALLAAGVEAELLVAKTVVDGITFALAASAFQLYF